MKTPPYADHWPFVLLDGEESPLIWPQRYYCFGDGSCGVFYADDTNGFDTQEEALAYSKSLFTDEEVSTDANQLGMACCVVLTGLQWTEELTKRDILNDFGHFTEVISDHWPPKPEEMK